MKRIALALVLLLVISILPANAEAVWFPDPAPAFGGVSAYIAQDTYDGISYDVYICEVDTTLDTVSSALVGYTEALRDMGYSIQGYNHETAISYQSFTYGGYAAEVMISVVDGFEEVLDGGVGTFEIFFVVPTAFDFTVGSGVANVIAGSITCSDCNGSGKCAYCIGGSVNYGAGYEDCVVCDGYGVCTICEGVGYYG